MNDRQVLTTAIRAMIKEELANYDKKQFKEIKKETPPTLAKERKATEEVVCDKKKQFLEAITAFVHEYNTNCMDKGDEMVDKLMEVGKLVGAKRKTVQDNLQVYGQRPKIYAFEVVQLFQDNPNQGDEQMEYETPSQEKSGDPEKAKEVKEKEQLEGKTDKEVAKSNVKATMGNTEAAKGKPKGVKLMSAVAKTAKGIKKMGKNSK